MVNRTPSGAFVVKPLVAPVVLTSSLTAATNAITVDTAGYSHCTICAALGANDYADVDETMTFQLMEGTSATAVACTDVSGATYGPCADTAFESKTIPIFSVPLGGARARYLSVDIDIAGTSPSFAVSLFAILSGPKQSNLATATWTAVATTPGVAVEEVPA